MAKLIKISGEESEVRPRKGKRFTYEEMRAFVGGRPEIREIAPNNFIVGAEGADEKGLPLNTEVSLAWWGMGSSDLDHIAGDVLLASSQEIGSYL